MKGHRDPCQRDSTGEREAQPDLRQPPDEAPYTRGDWYLAVAMQFPLFRPYAYGVSNREIARARPLYASGGSTRDGPCRRSTRNTEDG